MKPIRLPADQDPQRRFYEQFRAVLENPLFRGVHLTDVTVGTANLIKVKHGLGRRYRGWFSTNGVVMTEDLTNPNKTTELWLIPDSAVDFVDLWVF